MLVGKKKWCNGAVLCDFLTTALTWNYFGLLEISQESCKKKTQKQKLKNSKNEDHRIDNYTILCYFITKALIYISLFNLKISSGII